MNGYEVTILLWITALGSGLMAGVYFAFSGFIMRAFAHLDASQSIAAMNAVNTTILKSSFMPLFFGSTATSLLLVIAAVWHWGGAGAGLVFVAGLVYFVGMFVTTMVCNVPLNNALASAGGEDDEAQRAWLNYLKNWTRWNHFRTLCSLVTCTMCIAVLSGHYIWQ